MARLMKGSQAAKEHMAKLRAMRGKKVKKVRSMAGAGFKAIGMGRKKRMGKGAIGSAIGSQLGNLLPW